MMNGAGKVKSCMGEGGLLLLLIFEEKKSDGHNLELESIWNEKLLIIKGFNDSFSTSSTENILLDILGNLMAEPRLPIEVLNSNELNIKDYFIGSSII